MTLYVAEISGRGVVAFEAANEDEAKARLADRAFQRDLYVFQNEGRSLWDGVAEIHLREARPKEAESWQAGRAAGQSDKSDDREDWRVFLIPVVDPSSFDDDDHDDDDHGD